MEKTINEQLGYIREGKEKGSIEMTGLFKDWYNRTAQLRKDTPDGDGYYCLVCDGLLRKNGKSTADDMVLDKAWKEAEKRIIFLIKDQNQSGQIWADDTRNWYIDREDNRDIRSKFIRNIANISWGLMKSTPDIFLPAELVYKRKNDIKENFAQVPIALIECKKQGGGASISNNVLLRYLKDYQDLLYKEFDILTPEGLNGVTMFVCTNEHIYEFVQQYILSRHPNTELTRIDSEKHNSIRLHIPSKTMILCSYHPSAHMSYKEIYKGVLDHYQAFVKTNYYNQFF